MAGPFDVGTVVVRQALTLNPETAEVAVDGAASDPIPHILAGIPLQVRDIRVYVDRPNFTLNPTSCDRSSATAHALGRRPRRLQPADDAPVDLAARFQAANCAGLGFKPKLSLKLKGGTKRGDHPALRGGPTARARATPTSARRSVRLPHSAFLEQAHIRTICTRVQFAANQCPPGSIYGHARATTPARRTARRPGLPALLQPQAARPGASLHGLVDFDGVARIDSVGDGRIRSTFDFVPDAPLTKVVLEMQGGKKGLIVNSRNLCAPPSARRSKPGATTARE